MMTFQTPPFYLDARIQFPSPVERKLVQKKKKLADSKAKKKLYEQKNQVTINFRRQPECK